MMWDFSTLADRLAAVLAAAEAALRLEQAVYGLDSKDEIQIQNLIADGFRTHYDVAREVHYPSSVGRKLTHRQRCDLVLTERGLPLRLDIAPPTLFDAPNQCDAAEALWLEVKTAYQTREDGRAHGGYGAQWRQAVVADLKKMESEPLVHHAGLIMIVFTESEAIVNKDLELFEDVLVRKEVLAGFRQVRHTAILDRMGHRICTVALWPTVQR
ncbi:MAG: hypothetical protein JO353_04260 [Phycisphaerae bacterium]|nr:hypothetical protein [Phycisphaerae bacterium]